MKKSEFIQHLSQYRAAGVRVMSIWLFRGQDSEAIRQLKAILRHQHVASLANDSELPTGAIDSIKSVIANAVNPDPYTRAVLSSLRQALNIDEMSSAVSTSAASSTSTLSSSSPNASSLLCLPALLIEEIFSWLPTEEQERREHKNFIQAQQTQPKLTKEALFGGRRALFSVFATTKSPDLAPARIGVVNAMQQPFLQLVASAEKNSVAAILKLAEINKPMLQQLLTTSQTVSEENRFSVTGTGLQISLKCWDWALCLGGKEGIAELIQRFMQKLPEGKSLIQAQMQGLHPEEIAALLTAQQARAAEFIQTILEPLATLIKTASDADIKLVYDLTGVADEGVDAYIAEHLEHHRTPNHFWGELMKVRSAIKAFLEKETKESPLYNPYILQQAIHFCIAKYETEQWQNTLRSGWERLTLLSIHAIGGTQVFSARYILMLFARGSMYDFAVMSEAARKNFEPQRAIEFKHDAGCNAMDRTKAGFVGLGIKFWAAHGVLGRSGARMGPALLYGWVGILLSSKNPALGNLIPLRSIDPTPTLTPNQACSPDEITHSSSRTGI